MPKKKTTKSVQVEGEAAPKELIMSEAVGSEGLPSGEELLHEPREIGGKDAGDLSDGADPDLPPARRATKRRKPVSPLRAKNIRKKIKLLKHTLRFVPFRPPSKSLELSKYQDLFTNLGLWDFAHLQFDQEMRSDLLASLFAEFATASSKHFVYVNGQRIMLGRVHVARALKLPSKKDQASSSDFRSLSDEMLSPDAVRAVGDFVSNYILLHEDDTWMMPSEITSSLKLIKEGQPHKVDYPGMIWHMIRRELSQNPELEPVCHYAPHLQLLIKHQKPELFNEQPEASVSEEDGDEEGIDAEEKTCMSPMVKELDNVQLHGEESSKLNPYLGFDKNEEKQVHANEIDDRKEENQELHQNHHGCGLEDECCLRSCMSNMVKNVETRDNLSDPCIGMGKSSITQLLLENMDPCKIRAPGEFVVTDANATIDLLNGSGVSVCFDTNKQENMHGNGVSGCSFKGLQGRMDQDDLLHQTRSGFSLCMEKMQNWLDKLRGLYEEKEKECTRERMRAQSLALSLSDRDEMIQSLSIKVQEQQKRERDFYILQREFAIMVELLDGYKKALFETRRMFSEYRKKFNTKEEPIYKDVGQGGIVLTLNDFEKLRQEKEREHRAMLCKQEKVVGHFEQNWHHIFCQHLQKIDLLDQRLQKAEHSLISFRSRKGQKI